jgi:hypothetical protein
MGRKKIQEFNYTKSEITGMTLIEKRLLRKLGEKLKNYGFTKKEIREAKIKELEKIKKRGKEEKAKLLESALDELFAENDEDEEDD